MTQDVSPDRVSTLSRPGTRPGIQPVIRNDRLEEAAILSRFPAALSAAGIRFSVIRFPPGNWALLAVGLPDLGPDLDGVTTFRTRELQPGWVPSLPRGRRCSSRPSSLLDRRLPLRNGQSLHPAPASHLAGLCLTRHQRGFKQFTRPAFPSPVDARMERAALGLSFGVRTPPTKSRRRTPRWRQAIEHGPGTTRSTSHSG